MFKKKLGFSLLEFTIVIAIIIILSSFATIPLGWLQRVTVHNQLETLYMAIHYARQGAQLKNSPCKICFAKNHYTLDQEKHLLHAGVVFDYIPNSYGPPGNPIHKIGSAITFENKTLTISKDGVLQAGTIYVTDVHKKYLYALTSSVGEFPYLRKYYYNNGTWEKI